jgi:Asp-tRNA(Asn)/Glu-tRNA(Gln) amidotransferase A subunit family amidase
MNRTPGGSSSGSAAAVAAGMAAFALGSQTQGSILRPASYCGVTGFKPTFGLISTEGVLPFAPSLDTVGFFTETAVDMLELMTAVRPPAPSSTAARPALAAFRQPAIAEAVARLRAAGFAVTAIDPPAGFDRLLAASKLINAYEGARTHEERWRLHGENIGRKLAALVREGLAIPAQQYDEALDTVRAMRIVMAGVFREYPAVLTQAATGPAPLGLESTGDPAPNAPWTALGGPAISVPMPVEGPPLGLQLAAAADHDALLLATAVQVESALC